MIVAILRPAVDKHGKPSPGQYMATARGVAATAAGPERKLARALLGAGCDPAEPYQTKWDPRFNGGMVSMTWPTLAAAAEGADREERE